MEISLKPALKSCEDILFLLNKVNSDKISTENSPKKLFVTEKECLNVKETIRIKADKIIREILENRLQQNESVTEKWFKKIEERCECTKALQEELYRPEKEQRERTNLIARISNLKKEERKIISVKLNREETECLLKMLHEEEFEPKNKQLTAFLRKMIKLDLPKELVENKVYEKVENFLKKSYLTK
ncbi:hypothetical protein NUSPORA_00637 [Nucleospora cyclopteri]